MATNEHSMNSSEIMDMNQDSSDHFSNIVNNLESLENEGTSRFYNISLIFILARIRYNVN